MVSIKYGTGNDPYCYKDTDVLINQLEIKDTKILEQAETEISQLSLENIDFAPPPYDFSYLSNIHPILFSDLYSWAGLIRTIGMTKGDTMFCRPEYVHFLVTYPLQHRLTAKPCSARYFCCARPSQVFRRHYCPIMGLKNENTSSFLPAEVKNIVCPVKPIFLAPVKSL